MRASQGSAAAQVRRHPTPRDPKGELEKTWGAGSWHRQPARRPLSLEERSALGSAVASELLRAEPGRAGPGRAGTAYQVRKGHPKGTHWRRNVPGKVASVPDARALGEEMAAAQLARSRQVGRFFATAPSRVLLSPDMSPCPRVLALLSSPLQKPVAAP